MKKMYYKNKTNRSNYNDEFDGEKEIGNELDSSNVKGNKNKISSLDENEDDLEN